METNQISHPFQPIQNGGVRSAFSKMNGAPKERVIQLSGPNLHPSEKERPDIKTLSGGFIPIPQFGENGRDYYLDSDLETIAEESSVLESDVDDRWTPRDGTPQSESETSVDGEISGRSSATTLSSSSTSLDSQTSAPTPTVQQNTSSSASVNSKIVYAKCLSPQRSPNVSRIQDNESGAIQHEENQYHEKRKQHRKNVNQLYEENETLTMSDMFHAVAKGDLRTLAKFSSTEQCETVDELGNTILHMAATAGQLESIKYLVNGNLADAVSILNDELMTPTALAVMRGHLNCVQWMVENTEAKKELIVSSRQASIDGSSMRPPLPHVAARYNQDQVLDWLCELMVKEKHSVDSADHHSNTATHVAAAYGHLKSLQILVGRGASVTVLNSNGDTPGQVADKNGNDLCVGYLVVVETCMSLAQQLIRVKLDNEGLVKENTSMKMQLQAMQAAKLAEARESVEERIKATLQNISSTDEDSDSQIESQKKNFNYGRPNDVPSPSTQPALRQSKREVVITKPSTIDQPPRAAISSRHLHTMNDGVTENNRTQSHRIDKAINPSTSGKQAKNTSGYPNTNFDIVRTPTEKPTNMNYTQHQMSTEMPPRGHANDHTLRNGLDSRENHPNQGNAKDQIKDSNVNGPTNGAKAWEQMAMDEVLRLSRDSRYLPSPTISMCTEDSTMEPREVMRDRMAEASRWFMVQQSGGRAHLKDSRVSQRFRPPNYSTNSFVRPKTSPSGNRTHAMVGPINQGSKTGPMPARIIPTHSATLSHSQQSHSREHPQMNGKSHTIHAPGRVTDIEPFKVNAVDVQPTGHKSNQIGSIVSIRPSSAKSSASSSSTLCSNNSTSSTPSTGTSNNSVIESTVRNTVNMKKSHQDGLRSSGSGSGSPASTVKSGSTVKNATSRSNASTNYSNNTISKRQQESFSTNTSGTAAATIPLPMRNNSFMRRVQPPSPTLSSNRRNITNSYATSAGTHDSKSAKSSSVTTKYQSGSQPGTFNGFAYYLPRQATQQTHIEDLPTANDSIKKSSSKQIISGQKSSNSPKVSGKKKGTKLFHF